MIDQEQCIDVMKAPMRSVDVSPTNVRDNSSTHSTGIGHAGSLVKSLVQQRPGLRYVWSMMTHERAAATTRNT